MDRIAIIGLGLIGGSIGLALKRSGVQDVEIVGTARSRETALLRALEPSRGRSRRTESRSARSCLRPIASPSRRRMRTSKASGRLELRFSEWAATWAPTICLALV